MSMIPPSIPATMVRTVFLGGESCLPTMVERMVMVGSLLMAVRMVSVGSLPVLAPYLW
jgi:hypothetical protein